MRTRQLLPGRSAPSRRHLSPAAAGVHLGPCARPVQAAFGVIERLLCTPLLAIERHEARHQQAPMIATKVR